MSVIEIKSSCVPSLTTQICTPSAVMRPLICLSILAPFQTKIRQISHCQPSFRIEHMFVLIILETNMCSSLDLYERRKMRRARSTWLRAPQKLASQNVTEPPTHSGRPPNAKAPRGLFRTYGAHRQLGRRTLCAAPAARPPPMATGLLAAAQQQPLLACGVACRAVGSRSCTLLAAVGVRAARRAGNRQHGDATQRDRNRGVGRGRVGQAGLRGPGRLAVGGLAALGSVTALSSTVLGRRLRAANLPPGRPPSSWSTCDPTRR